MKTVLITGSTSGIGLGIAKEFAKTRLYNIVFNGLEANGADIAGEISTEFGIETMFSNANMLEPDALKEMVSDAAVKFGRVDILVNNAGIQHVSGIEDFPDTKWTEIISVNLNAAFHLTKAVWKGMRTQKFGRIINIASAHGLRASPFKSAYIASKHAIVGFTKAIALEGAPYQITANAICPGYVKTAMVEQQIHNQAKANNISREQVITEVMLAKQAIKEFIPVELIGQMALFLASENAGQLTGAALPVDGGWSAQ